MSGQIIQIRSIALAVPLFALGVGITGPSTPAHAEDCLTTRQGAAPNGSHWYYHTDREKRRKCWFLAPTGSRPHASAKARSARAARAARAHAAAIEKPATAPVSSPKTQPAPVSSATAREPVQQRVQEARPAPSAPEPLNPPVSAFSQTGAHTGVAAPATTIIWPDPPAVDTVKAQRPKLVLSDASGDSVLPRVDTRAPDDSQRGAQRAPSTTDAHWLGASPAATFLEVLLVVALGLGVAGLLYRVVMKVAARPGAKPSAKPGRPAVRARVKPDWVDGLSQRQRRDNGRQRGAASEGEQSIGDLHPSLVPAAGDYRARRAPRTDDQRQINPRSKNSAPQTTDDVSGHENALAQLIQDLDQMLQSRKGA